MGLIFVFGIGALESKSYRTTAVGYGLTMPGLKSTKKSPKNYFTLTHLRVNFILSNFGLTLYLKYTFYQFVHFLRSEPKTLVLLARFSTVFGMNQHDDDDVSIHPFQWVPSLPML